LESLIYSKSGFNLYRDIIQINSLNPYNTPTYTRYKLYKDNLYVDSWQDYRKAIVKTKLLLRKGKSDE